MITYGGHPVATAAALANLDVKKRENMVENAKNMAEEKDPITGTLTNIMCRVYIRNDHSGYNF